MSKQRPVTLKNLAGHLGLGITTVSDILLRNKTNYRAATVDRVRAAAKELGYQPNALAQGIRRGKTQTIGVLVTFNILDPFFAELVNRLEERFESQGLMVLLSISENDLERDRETLRFFESRRVDGVVVGPVYRREAVRPVFEHYTSTLPMVMFLSDPDAPTDAVNVTSSPPGRIGQLAADHFIRNGHRKIGYLMCPEHRRSDAGNQPYRGFHSVLEPLGLLNPDWIWVAKRPLAQLAYEKMRGILANNRRADLPTAIYCHNDHCAIGAMAAIREAGLRVPEDFSLIGTDNTSTSAFTDPPLTTVDLKPTLLADEVFKLMRLRLEEPSRPRSIVEIVPEFVERQTVRRIAT